VFAIFINDLPQHLKHCKHHLFADDLQIMLSFRPSEMAQVVKKIIQDLQNIERWAIENGLKLNAKKTKMIVIGTKNRVAAVKSREDEHPIQFMNKTLKYEKSVRNLGVIFDEVLKWTAHTNNIVKRVHFKLKHLSNFCNVLNENVKNTL
jgi:Reverse transcriptase (RNA-dependent DNA polymerase)